LAIAVFLGAALDLFVALRPNPEPISAEVMTAAAEKMKQAMRPGDTPVHSPLFSMAELSKLDPAIAAKPDVPTQSIRASRRIVVLDRTDHPIRGLGSAAEVIAVPESKGALEVLVFEPQGPREAVLYELVQRIRPETMRVERPAGTVTAHCTMPRPEGGFGCPGEPDWLYVAPRMLGIEGHEVSCVWAHPTTAGVIVLEIPAQAPLPEGARYVLTIRAGLTDDAVRQTADGAPVRTDVVQNGESKGALVVPNRIGWQETTVGVDPGTPIELRVTTPKDGRRHHCINAELKQIDAGEKR
jgi:hypothetical protein